MRWQLLLWGVAVVGAVPAAVPPGTPAPAAALEQGGVPTAPQALMRDLSVRLFAALGSNRESEAARLEPAKVRLLLEQLLAPHFDTPYTARLVLGASWSRATQEQRQRFAAALFDTLLETYARSVSEWTPERFRILPSQDDPAALRVTVRTQVARPNGTVVAVDYRLHETPAGWLVFDVIVDGSSYVRTYHDDVDTEISQRGLESVIERLESRSTARAHPQRRPVP